MFVVIEHTEQAVWEAATICPAPCKLPVGGRPAVASLQQAAHPLALFSI